MSRGIDVFEARKTLAMAVATASGLRGSFAYVPDSLDKTPLAFVGAPSLEYDKTFGKQGRTELTLPLTVVVGRFDDRGAQERLDRLVSNLPLVGDGTTINEAVKALEGTTYPICRVTEARNAGRTEPIGGTEYLAVDLMVTVVS
jgi:hypothetical protein